MTEKLKPIQIHGNLTIKKILDDGFNGFKEVVDQYCDQNGSHDTILGWGNEKTYLSMFSQEINKKSNRNCFLEMSFLRTVKNMGGSKGGYKQGRVDALLIDRSMSNKTLTAVIEAKAEHLSISKEKASQGNIRRPLKALETAKEQLESIDPEDIHWDEQLASERHIYRIALIFTVVRVKFAASGEGENMNWNDYEVIKSRAEDYFNTVENKIKRKNICHYKHIHSTQQLKLIREYNGTTMINKEGKEVEITPAYTHYNIGVLVTTAIFQ